MLKSKTGARSWMGLLLVALQGCTSEPLGADAAGGPGTGGDGAGAEAGTGGSVPCDRSLAPSQPASEQLSPQFELPSPRGPYPVGTHIEWWSDASRPEPVTADSEDARGVGVQFFYPSQESTEPFGPWIDDRLAAIIERGWEAEGRFDVPADFNRVVATHSRFDVPLSDTEERWPVVVYSHGQTTFPQENQALFEDLASFGWVVVALSHTYSADATLLPDGTVARTENVPPVLPDSASNAERRERSRLISDLHQNVWAPDVAFVLDELERTNESACSWLEGRLDLERLGLVGYSFGGSTVFEVCLKDERCKAAVGYDGGLWTDLETVTTSDKPLLYLRTDTHETTVWDLLHGKLAGSSYSAWLVGASHGNFSHNLMLLEALLGASSGNDMGSERAYQLVRDYTFAMLNNHVLGQPDALLSTVPAEPDVILERNEAGESGTEPSVFGKTQTLGEAPLAGVEVVLGARADTSTRTGTWRFDAVDVDTVEPLRLRFVREGYAPLATAFSPRRRFENLPFVTLLSDAALTQLTSSAGLTPDPVRGHLWLKAYATEHDRFVGRATGLSATVSEGSFYYGSAQLALDPDLAATRENQGWAFAANLEPGAHVLDVSVPGAECVEENGAGRSASGLTVEIVAGAVTEVALRCAF